MGGPLRAVPRGTGRFVTLSAVLASSVGCGAVGGPDASVSVGPRDPTQQAPITSVAPARSASNTSVVDASAVAPPEVTSTPVGSGAPGSSVSPACSGASAWTLRQRVAQLVMAGVDGSSIRDARRLVERDEPIGGLFLRGNDDEIFRTDALRLLIAGAAVAPLVAVDDEGGRVQRIDQLVGPIPSARQQAASLTPSEVQAIGVERGRQLASLGVTVDFAPVVDVVAPARLGRHRGPVVRIDCGHRDRVCWGLRGWAALCWGAANAEALPRARSCDGRFASVGCGLARAGRASSGGPGAVSIADERGPGRSDDGARRCTRADGARPPRIDKSGCLSAAA